jgi:nucleotide-binding universal stress UspA family protein
MKSILCATDLSSRAELAADRAAALARQFGAKLRLLHVVDEDQPRAIADVEATRARELLAAGIVEPDAAAPPADRLVKTGVVFRTIVSTAQEVNADLIVMGAHRRRVLQDIVVGTTIERVMRTGRHPVLMVNTATSGPYESVLLALDASKASIAALDCAKSLRLLDNSRLSVVRAFEPVYKGMLGWAGLAKSTITEYSAAWAREAEIETRGLVRQAGVNETSMRLFIEEGPPFLVVKRAVARLAPQLLVIGTHGRAGIGRVLLGSVAEGVIREADCDILVVPSERDA